MSAHYHSLLSLGDSYTIGESVPLHASFPYQAVQMLRKAGVHFHAPEIIAETGWTSFELGDHLINQLLNEQYDFVSLLIGVNNQYRGLPIADFETEFEFLLKKAIHLVDGNAAHTIVFSIPDWSVTPFAAKRSVGNAAKEIDAFNAVCLKIAKKYHCNFIDVTVASRLVKNNADLLAADHLHYSAKTYAEWAEKLATVIKGLVVHHAVK